MDFVSFLSELAPMDVVRRLGLVIMHVVFVLLLVRQVLQFLRNGTADFFTPLLHYIIGLLCISFLPEIGKALVHTTRQVSSVIYADQNITEFLATEGQHYDKTTNGYELNAAFLHFLNGESWLRLIARMFILAMLVLKVVLIDILWQVFFAMTTMLGAFTIPLSLMYGANALTAWFRSLLELMLWPIIYSVLMLIMNAVITDGDGFILSSDYLEEDLKRICASWAVILLTLFTPFLARSMMRSEPLNAAPEQMVKIAMVSKIAATLAKTGVGAIATMKPTVTMSDVRERPGRHLDTR